MIRLGNGRALRILALALCTLLSGLGLHAAAAGAGPPTPLILVSIDGFRADYLDREQTPVLSRLAAEGVHGVMRPSFPTITFPNHYTLVTGLRPDHHGITDNTMEDTTLPPGRFTQATGGTDRRWWDDAEPLWVTARRQGLRTATLFWPGSEAAIHDVRPNDWLKFDQTLPAAARVDTLLGWLDRPVAERPAFLTLYFDQVDSAGHKGGPGASELDAALRDTDAAIGRLVEGLKARGLAGKVNLIIVADHGMAEISPDRRVYLDDLTDLAHVHVVTMGPSAGLRIEPEAGPDVLARLLNPHPHVQCWRKGEIPAALHYGTHRRIPPVFCLAETGWMITTHARAAAQGAGGHGAHGFRPDAPEMAALFIAHGPGLRSGVTVPAFDNVDVYPLMTRLLRIAGRPHDGSEHTFDRVVATPPCDLKAPDAARAGTGCARAWMDANLAMNDILTVGTHNSYKRAISEPVMALLRKVSPDHWQELDYHHPPLLEQLNDGARAIEIDIANDPKGGLYAHPAGLKLTGGALTPEEIDTLSRPGIKVLHIQDVDFRTNCLTFIECLTTLRTWSQAHPDHAPILITMNTNDGKSRVPGGVEEPVFDEAAYDAVEAEILSVFPRDALITPDQVQGSAPTLRDAVLTHGWPKLGDARGRFLFAVDEEGRHRAAFIGHRKSLEGRIMFVNGDETSPASAYLTLNEASDAPRIATDVKRGFLVRTRADAGTVEARTNDTGRRAIALSSGAQYVSTDYRHPETRFSDYQVRLPGEAVAVCNPQRQPERCVGLPIEP